MQPDCPSHVAAMMAVVVRGTCMCDEVISAPLWLTFSGDVMAASLHLLPAFTSDAKQLCDPCAGLLLPTGFMVPKTYTLDLRLTADHFAVKRGFAAPTTFSADAEATFEILQDTSCLLLHAQVRRLSMHWHSMSAASCRFCVITLQSLLS